MDNGIGNTSKKREEFGQLCRRQESDDAWHGFFFACQLDLGTLHPFIRDRRAER